MSVAEPLDTCWLPPRVAALANVVAQVETVERRGPAGVPLTLRRARLGHAELAQVATVLATEARDRLRLRPVASIIAALDRVARLWLDPATPERRRAIEAIAAWTGFSTPMVGHALDLEFESSLGPHLERALRSELGGAGVLDGFVDDPALGGRRHAVAPLLVGGIASANIPGLPHLIATRALLVKSACWIRSSRDEPIFLPLFARTLARVDGELGAALAIVDFDPDHAALLDAFLEHSEHLIAYGGTAALAGLARRVPVGKRATWHGHRLGFTAIGREALAGDVRELADRVAYDFSLFDREACLSPQLAFVEAGGEGSPRAFAHAVADAMCVWAERLPPARLPLGDRARFRQSLDTLALRGAAGEAVEVIADAPGFAVVLEDAASLAPAPRGRFVRIVSVPTIEDVVDRVRPAGAHLQVACIEACEERRVALARALAALGVTRITRPGLAGLPSMMWRHDGIACVGSLVRWVDEELVAPRERG